MPVTALQADASPLPPSPTAYRGRPSRLEMTIKELKNRAVGDIDAALAKAAAAKETSSSSSSPEDVATDGVTSESDLSEHSGLVDRRSATSPELSSVDVVVPVKQERESPAPTQKAPESPGYHFPYRPTPISPRDYMESAFPLPPAGFHPSMLRPPQGWPPFMPGLVPMDMHRRGTPFQQQQQQQQQQQHHQQHQQQQQQQHQQQQQQQQQPSMDPKDSPLEGRSFSDLMRSMAAKYNDSPQENKPSSTTCTDASLRGPFGFPQSKLSGALLAGDRGKLADELRARMKDLQPLPTSAAMFASTPNHLKRAHAAMDPPPPLASPKKLKEGFFSSPYDSRSPGGGGGGYPAPPPHPPGMLSQMSVFPMPIRVATPAGYPAAPPIKTQDTLLTKMLNGESKEEVERYSPGEGYRPSSRGGDSQGSPNGVHSTRVGGGAGGGGGGGGGGGRSPSSQDSVCSHRSTSPRSRERSHMAAWSVDDVYEFVRSIDLCAEYADTFRQNSVDGATLPLLTEDHLMASMSMKLGPALKLRATISKLQNNCNNCIQCIRRYDSSPVKMKADA
ncbi:PREDICTED: probable tumor suppressor protein MN1 isoform X2 [Priapulus caudatus]|uniref:Probable tumor suppressor protein MN1 isoform X2 n=1 Tax=Priapulus caudatus TaxID=37621 RepID=A0ABM1ETI7_PRICU|nr:PREDICTED: probable tumor suppressor protein MN1 isoform X2 [Priapulus caudatus]